MKRIVNLFIFSLIMLIVGCATISIKSDYNPNADFAKYRTFNWPANLDDFTANVIKYNPFLHKEIKRIIEEEMVAKGYVKTDDKPDMIVVYHVTTEQKTNVTTYSGGYYGWGYHGWGVSRTDVRVDHYTEGTLILDFVDAEEEDLIWRCWATGTVADKPNYAKIRDMIRGMLDRYPPQ
ncbi:DUF4136 domain-containing protein [bacterium]|nr:DUF4136 domain-containing protein [bacterium]